MHYLYGLYPKYVKETYRESGYEYVDPKPYLREEQESLTDPEDLEDKDREVVYRDAREEFIKDFKANYRVFKSRDEAKKYILRNKEKAILPYILVETKKNGRKKLTNVNPQSILKKHVTNYINPLGTLEIRAKSIESANIQINKYINMGPGIVGVNTKVKVFINGKSKTFRGGDLIKESYIYGKRYIRNTTPTAIDRASKRIIKRKFRPFRYKKIETLQVRVKELETKLGELKTSIKDRESYMISSNIAKELLDLTLYLEKKKIDSMGPQEPFKRGVHVGDKFRLKEATLNPCRKISDTAW